MENFDKIYNKLSMFHSPTSMVYSNKKKIRSPFFSIFDILQLKCIVISRSIKLQYKFIYIQMQRE